MHVELIKAHEKHLHRRKRTDYRKSRAMGL